MIFNKLITMAFRGLENITVDGPEDILTYPLTGDFYFWAKILFGIWVVLGLSTFFEERLRLGKGNFLSSFAVSSIAVIVLALIGSLFEIVTGEVFVATLVLGILFIFIWFIKSRR